MASSAEDAAKDEAEYQWLLAKQQGLSAVPLPTPQADQFSFSPTSTIPTPVSAPAVRGPTATVPPPGAYVPSPTEEADYQALLAKQRGDVPPVQISGSPSAPDAPPAQQWNQLREGQKAEYEKLPDYAFMPELHHLLSSNTDTAILGLLSAGPEDLVKIVQKQFPGVEASQDGGYVILKSKEDGQKYAWKPHAQFSDVIRTALGIGVAGLGAGAVSMGLGALPGAGLLAAIPGATATAGVVGAGLSAAGGGYALEDLKRRAGGDFKPLNVALQGAVGAGVPMLGKTLRTALNYYRGAAPAAGSAAANTVASLVPAEDQAMGSLYGKMAAGVPGAKEEFGRQLGYDVETAGAAQRTGLLDKLPPEVLGTNPVAKAYIQATRSVPTSESAPLVKNKLREVGQGMRDLLEEWGGIENGDRGLESAQQLDKVRKIDTGNKARTSGLYDKYFGVFPKESPVKAPRVLKFIKEEARGFGGAANDELSPFLAHVKKVLTPRREIVDRETGKVIEEAYTPTHGTLDKLTREAGTASRPNSPWREENEGLMARAFKELSGDRAAAARASGTGASKILDEAAAASIVTKDFRKSIADAFGNQTGRVIEGELQPQMNRAVSELINGQTEMFRKVIKGLPIRDIRSVTTSALERFFGDFTEADPVVFSKFVKRFEKLRGPGDTPSRAYSMLMDSITPEAKAGFPDLYRVSKQIAETAKYHVPNGRLMTVMGQEASQNAFAKIAELASWTGGPTAPFTKWVSTKLGSDTSVLSRAADAVISSPEFAAIPKALLGAAPVKVNESWIRMMANSAQFERLMNAAMVPESERVAIIRKWFTRGVQGAPTRSMERDPEMSGVK